MRGGRPSRGHSLSLSLYPLTHTHERDRILTSASYRVHYTRVRHKMRSETTTTTTTHSPTICNHFLLVWLTSSKKGISPAPYPLFNMTLSLSLLCVLLLLTSIYTNRCVRVISRGLLTVASAAAAIDVLLTQLLPHGNNNNPAASIQLRWRSIGFILFCCMRVFFAIWIANSQVREKLVATAAATAVAVAPLLSRCGDGINQYLWSTDCKHHLKTVIMWLDQ